MEISTTSESENLLGRVFNERNAWSNVKVLLTALTFVVSVMICGFVSARDSAPAEEVSDALVSIFEAMQAGNVDGMVAAYSDDYSDSQGGYKAILRGAFEMMVAQGVFKDWTFRMDECEFDVDGDSATASPVHFDSPLGKTAYSYKMKKEADGVWRIVNSEQT
jgi:ketosteroid isomerase-like protein